MSVLQPPYHRPMEPVYPCREMVTRHCPAIYDGVCGERSCARYESRDLTPWLPESPDATRAGWRL